MDQEVSGVSLQCLKPVFKKPELLSDTSKGDVLLVGEANFSFSASLASILDTKRVCLTATCYHENTSPCYQKDEKSQKRMKMYLRDADENVEVLKNKGCQVVYGVDATALNCCSNFQGKKFDIVIFMFPHCEGKSNLRDNRGLLYHFFQSVGQFLTLTGYIYVALCDGQGGTAADFTQRESQNTWKVVEVAAKSGFFIVDAYEFSCEDSGLQDYRPSGHRGQQSGFRRANAIIHVFASNPSTPVFKDLITPGGHSSAIAECDLQAEYIQALRDEFTMFQNCVKGFKNDLFQVFDRNITFYGDSEEEESAIEMNTSNALSSNNSEKSAKNYSKKISSFIQSSFPTCSNIEEIVETYHTLKNVSATDEVESAVAKCVVSFKEKDFDLDKKPWSMGCGYHIVGLARHSNSERVLNKIGCVISSLPCDIKQERNENAEITFRTNWSDSVASIFFDEREGITVFVIDIIALSCVFCKRPITQLLMCGSNEGEIAVPHHKYSDGHCFVNYMFKPAFSGWQNAARVIALCEAQLLLAEITISTVSDEIVSVTYKYKPFDSSLSRADAKVVNDRIRCRLMDAQFKLK